MMNEEKSEKRLKGKTVVVGVCASISIYRTLDIMRDLQREGADILVGMTNEAMTMIDPRLFEWASGKPVITDITGRVEHVELFLHREKEVTLLICPATYNMIGKMANGIADDVVSLFFSFAVGNGNPVIVCPVMHDAMMSGGVNRRNLSVLDSLGVLILPPILEDEKAKISGSNKVVDFVLKANADLILRDKNVLIIGGRGEEPIDPVRMITNRGTGLTGLFLSRYAFIYGSSHVVYVGNSDYSLPDYVEFHEAHTMEEYSKSVREILDKEKFEIVINSASLPDFTVRNKSRMKLDSKKKQQIDLEVIPKLNKLIVEKHHGKFVTFKLEGSEKPDDWKEILDGNFSDYVIYNSFSEKTQPYGEVLNHYYFIDTKGPHDMGLISKETMARKVFSMIKED